MEAGLWEKQPLPLVPTVLFCSRVVPLLHPFRLSVDTYRLFVEYRAVITLGPDTYMYHAGIVRYLGIRVDLSVEAGNASA